MPVFMSSLASGNSGLELHMHDVLESVTHYVIPSTARRGLLHRLQVMFGKSTVHFNDVQGSSAFSTIPKRLQFMSSIWNISEWLAFEPRSHKLDYVQAICEPWLLLQCEVVRVLVPRLISKASTRRTNPYIQNQSFCLHPHARVCQYRTKWSESVCVHDIHYYHCF